jgi:hypothetical protein
MQILIFRKDVGSFDVIALNLNYEDTDIDIYIVSFFSVFVIM